jgi:hypothetical protein
MGCDPYHKRLTLIEIEKRSNTIDPETTAHRPPRKHW